MEFQDEPQPPANTSDAQFVLVTYEQTWWRTALWTALGALYLYIAIRYYPEWRRLREGFFSRHLDKPKDDAVLKSANSAAYVLFFPFAAIYLGIRLAWDAYRLFVFYSLDAAEICVSRLASITVRGLNHTVKISAKALKSSFKLVTRGWTRYGWPVLRKTCTVTWRASVAIARHAFQACDTIVRLSKQHGAQLYEHVVWAFRTLVWKPATWILSRMIYLGRIAWHCACFLARDIVEDIRDLCKFGRRVRLYAWSTIIRPIVLWTRDVWIAYADVIKRCAVFIAAWTRDVSIALVDITKKCAEQVIAGFTRIAHKMMELWRSPFVQFLVEQTCQYFVQLERWIIEDLVPLLVGSVRKGILTSINDSTRTVAAGYALSVLLYYHWVLPALKMIPATHARVLSILWTVRGAVATMFSFVWTVIGPLMRPVYHFLRWFYATVILPGLLAMLPLARAFIAHAYTVLSFALMHAKRFASSTAALSVKLLSVLQQHLSVLYEQLLLVLRVPYGWCERFVTSVVNALATNLRTVAADVIERLQPVVVDASERVVATVDRAVVAAGDAMMEWAKKEHALREAISRKNTGT